MKRKKSTHNTVQNYHTDKSQTKSYCEMYLVLFIQSGPENEHKVEHMINFKPFTGVSRRLHRNDQQRSLSIN